jgi:pimeloyl-ACP methyl ester carboxylesterase
MKFLFLAILFFVSGSFAMVTINKTTFTALDGVQLNAKLYQSDSNVPSKPGILIIEGSGKSGFTEEPEGSPFAELSKALAAEGFTVLKYNKRGSGENASNGSFWKATFSSDNQDAEAALKLLQSQSDVNSSKIFLIGHSFGGPQSLLLASKNKVSGVVMLTSTIRPTDDLLLEQNTIIMSLQGMAQTDIDNYIKSMKSDLARIKSNTFDCQFPNCSKMDGIPAYEGAIQVPWLYEVLNMNFASIARSVQTPILFIFGSSDPVIPETDYVFAQETFKGLTNEIEIKMIPKLDHFMVENESKKDSLAYAARAQKEKVFKPISSAMTRTIVDWIKR